MIEASNSDRHLNNCNLSQSSTAMRILRQFDHYLAKFESWVLIFILFVMVFLSFGQVVLRNVFNFGLLWADTFLRQLVLWVGFLGASLAVREKRHIAIDFIPLFLPEGWLKPLRAVVDFATGIISIFLLIAAWNFLQFEKESGSILFLDLPVWIFQTILPFSLGVIAIRFLFRSLAGVRSIWKTEE